MTPLTPYGIVEFRQYTLHPGRRDELIELFEREFVETQEAAGMRLLGTFRDARRGDRFVWIRAFPTMESRRFSLAEFYERGAAWQTHRGAANATMIDHTNVLLLRPRSEHIQTRVRAPLIAAIYPRSAAPGPARFHAAGATVVASFETEASPNTYPRLPVREGEDVVVFLTGGVVAERLPESRAAEIVELVPTPRSLVQTDLP